jgi:phospholipase/carboxylesterase
LVALHGWGANLRDLVSLAPYFNLPDYQFIFPNAPFPHPQVPGGRAWYALDTGDYRGITESRQLLFEWLMALEENTGISLNNTVLLGFSQGGAMALDIGLSLPLKAICSLSGYLHFQPDPDIVEAGLQFPPVLMIHGQDDTVVPIEEAQRAKEELTAIAVDLEYHEFKMGHEISLEALKAIEQFILSQK